VRTPPVFHNDAGEVDPLRVLMDAARLGDVVQLQLGEQTQYLIREPRYIEHVLQGHYQDYRKHTRPYALTAPLFGEGLLNAEGEGWLRRRRMLQPAFHARALDAYVDEIDRTAHELSTRLLHRADAGGLVEVVGEVSLATSAALTRLLFGEDLSPFAHRWSELVETSLRTEPPTADGLALPRLTVSEADEVVLDKIARAREGRHGPLLAAFLAARGGHEEQALSDRELRDEIVTLMFAGVESTATMLGWTIMLLAEHPEVSERLRDELDDVVGERALTTTDLPRLPLLRMVLDESMRLYPPAWSISRRATVDDDIGGHAIPRGAEVLVSPWVTHRLPALWDEPESFRPERFDSERAASRHRYAFFPFLGGPHRCIGEHLSLLEASIILARALRVVRFKPSPFLLARPEARVTLQPRHGLWLFVARP